MWPGRSGFCKREGHREKRAGHRRAYCPPPLREVVGRPPEMKLSETAIIAEFRQAGFRLRNRSDILLYQYFLTFVRR